MFTCFLPVFLLVNQTSPNWSIIIERPFIQNWRGNLVLMVPYVFIPLYTFHTLVCLINLIMVWTSLGSTSPNEIKEHFLHPHEGSRDTQPFWLVGCLSRVKPVFWWPCVKHVFWVSCLLEAGLCCCDSCGLFLSWFWRETGSLLPLLSASRDSLRSL